MVSAFAEFHHPVVFQSGVSGFRYLFDPHRRDLWEYGAVAPVSFRDTMLQMPPGSCLTTQGAVFSDFIISGQVRRNNGIGSLTVTLPHAELGTVRIVIGDLPGVSYDRGGTIRPELLWRSKTAPDLEQWVPFQIGVNSGVLYVEIDGCASGPLEKTGVAAGPVIFSSAGCYLGLKDLVTADKREYL